MQNKARLEVFTAEMQEKLLKKDGSLNVKFQVGLQQPSGSSRPVLKGKNRRRTPIRGW